MPIDNEIEPICVQNCKDDGPDYYHVEHYACPDGFKLGTKYVKSKSNPDKDVSIPNCVATNGSDHPRP